MHSKTKPSALLTLFLAITATDPALAAKGKTAPRTPAESGAPVQKPLPNDFPTQARVEYVMQCMAEHGGTNLDNMYHCVCAVDKIASLMKFQDYSEAQTFTYMFDTPGDKGGEFRDPPKSRELRDRLKETIKATESCFPSIPGKANTPEGTRP